MGVVLMTCGRKIKLEHEHKEGFSFPRLSICPKSGLHGCRWPSTDGPLIHVDNDGFVRPDRWTKVRPTCSK